MSTSTTRGGETIIIGRFYDNDPKKFDGATEQTEDGVRKKFFDITKNGKRYWIECIHVDETMMNPWVIPLVKKYRGQSKIDGTTNLQTVPKKIKDNLSVTYFFEYFNSKTNPTPAEEQFFKTTFNYQVKDVRGNLLYRGYEEESLPSKGLTISHVKELRKWCRDHPHQPKVVFFDWDKTLTVLEGFLPMKLKQDDFKKYICAHAEYLFGGKTRMDRIKRMFAFLERHGVQVYILTNNATVYVEDEEPYFVALIRCVYPSFDPVTQLIGSRIYPSKKLALQSKIWRPIEFETITTSSQTKQQQQKQQQQQQKQQQQQQKQRQQRLTSA